MKRTDALARAPMLYVLPQLSDEQLTDFLDVLDLARQYFDERQKTMAGLAATREDRPYFAQCALWWEEKADSAERMLAYFKRAEAVK